MDLTHDHGEIAWSHFLRQYKKSPLLERVVKALYAPADELESALRQIVEDTWLDTAVGKQLDGIGEILGISRDIGRTTYVKFFGFLGQPNIGGFGEARLRHRYESPIAGSTSMPDSFYRRLLYWKITVNNGHGTAPEIAESIRQLYDVTNVTVTDNATNGNVDIDIGVAQDTNNPLMVEPEKWVPVMAGIGINITWTP